ncbi:amidohydrolase family protein [Rhodosalinus halophilus]|uniref:amidohydrolase family protein n=1 Tax=Rhodosalinus halophilus TaxID=2259333 RepID=UPI0018F4ABF3|nr:amidohydrolase family protein [Rhodosalinus halophilus]
MRDDGTSILDGVRIAGREGHWRLSAEGGRLALAPSQATGGGVVLPLMADAHVHLDKTYTSARMPGRPATLFDAIEMMGREALNWTESDLRARATLALGRAHAHGTGAMRSHVDWTTPGEPLAWGVLNDLAQDWRGRVELQLASLSPLDLLAEAGEEIARRVARDGGVLGAFVYRNEQLCEKVARVFDLAERHGLSLDFHVDEGLEPEARGLDAITEETGRRGFGGRVLCGHGCALSVRPEYERRAVLDQAGAAGLTLTVLPTTNMWLQDNRPGRTPRLRGLAPFIEARAAGVEILFASDNVRDGFYPHGDYDMADIFRAAVLGAQLEPEDWLGAVTTEAARWCGAVQSLEDGGPADFVWHDAADLDDLVSRPRAARQVWRHGRALEGATP